MNDRSSDMLDYSSIGKRIKRLRLQKHMTQEALSEKIDISAKHLSKIIMPILLLKHWWILQIS